MREELFKFDKYLHEGEYQCTKFIALNYDSGVTKRVIYSHALTNEQIEQLGGISVVKVYNNKNQITETVLFKDKSLLRISFSEIRKLKGKTNYLYRISCYYPDNYEESEFNQFFKGLKEEDKNEYGVAILAQNQQGFRLIYQDSAVAAKDIADNYPESFTKEIKKIEEEINEESKGLYLFSGPPGTGKTSFVNYLANKISRQFIYIPNTMVNSLDNPGFIEFLSNHPNSVLIIEDAEDCLKSRTTGNSGMVSTILNLTDGLLGEILKISVIATYNADDKIIDPALLRKGRLKHKHYFDKLPIKEAQALADKLGLKIKITEPTSLGDIYNYKDQDYGKPITSKMGFV